VTIEKGGFAILRAQRPIRVSENIIPSLFRIGGTMKKLLISTVTMLLLVLGVTSAVLAAPAAGERQLPLKGQLQGAETYTFFPTMFVVDGTGSGNATQLGAYTINFRAEVDLATLSSSTTATVIAASGDRLFGEGWGQGTPTDDPNVASVVEDFTITGGTGRFAGVSGSFTLERLVHLDSGFSSGTISGTIVLP
jgi:hypothetical protein